MDIKRALIISVIAVVIVTSINVVSAEFDDLGGEYYNNIYETSSFTVKYPMGYTLTADNKDGYNPYFEYSYKATRFDNTNENAFVTIEVREYGGSAKDAYKDLLTVELDNGEVSHNIDGGTTKIDGKKAYIVKDTIGKWTQIIVKKDNQLYDFYFGGDAQEQEIIDYFTTSFKFK